MPLTRVTAPRRSARPGSRTGAGTRLAALLSAVVSALVLLVAAPSPALAVAGAPAGPTASVGSLAPGASVVLGTTTLLMQSDGNLVLYTDGRAVWHSRTDGHPGAGLVVQGDGNLVVRAPDGRPLWDSGTHGLGATDLRLGPASLSLHAGSGREVWRNGSWSAASLSSGARLLAGEALLGRDRVHRLLLQADGNLVLYRGSVARWSSGTVGSGADTALLQDDGNLVLLSSRGAVWHSVTDGTGPARLQLQDDGNLVLYAGGGARWDSAGHTGAAGHHLLAGPVPAWALQVPPRTRQVVRAVPSTRWCSQVWCAVTELWRKRTDGTWALQASYRSQSGPNGFSPMPRRAGDGTTPSGVFGIATTFSVYDRAPGPMPWRRRYPTSTVSGSAPYYNTWIEEPGRTDGTRPATEYGLWVDFNNARMTPFVGPAPDPAIGSGIFVHTLPATARYIPSEGCIAIGERLEMLAVLQWLDPTKEPKVVLGR